jgi:hypothetical protein
MTLRCPDGNRQLSLRRLVFGTSQQKHFSFSEGYVLGDFGAKGVPAVRDACGQSIVAERKRA